jgi:hypothetical protein
LLLHILRHSLLTPQPHPPPAIAFVVAVSQASNLIIVSFDKLVSAIDEIVQFLHLPTKASHCLPDRTCRFQHEHCSSKTARVH